MFENTFKLQEFARVPDPFGAGVVFHIRPVSCKAFRDWARKALKIDLKQELASYREFLPEDAQAAVITPRLEKALAESDAEWAEGAAILLAGWEGSDEEFTPQSVRDLFALEAPVGREILIGKREVKGEDGETVVEPTMTDALTPAGEALVAWILWQGRNAEHWRVEEEERAGES